MQTTAASSLRDPAFQFRPDDVLTVSVGTLQVECVDVAALESRQASWLDLAGRAIEPNIFLEPAFALPLLRNLGLSRRLGFVLVWEEDGPDSFSRLVGLFPVVAPGLLSFARNARSWAHNQICLGVPLVDRDRASTVLDIFMAWLDAEGPATLTLQLLPKEGAFLAALERVCQETSRELELIEDYPRAMLQHAPDAADRLASFVSSKRRKEQARLSRRLSELGRRAFTSARTPPDVARATEHFLSLEHAGWKGLSGSSFLSDPAQTAFLRELTKLMAAEGKCRIEAIEVDDRPVAMGIILTTGERSHYWKTTFDEHYAALSPGVQFTLELTQHQLADPQIVVTDSCAVTDHPMIDKIWPDRLLVGDIMIGVRPGARRRFKQSLQMEKLRRDLRWRAKSALYGLRRLRRG